MKNIVVASKKNVAYYKIMAESCKRYNIDLVVLGLGKKWNGLSDKYKYWKEYLATLHDHEIVMMNDAYDVIIMDTPEHILQRFHAFGKPVVCGIQKGFPLEYIFPKAFSHIICTGNIIGYVKSIRIIIDIIMQHKHLWNYNSDQITFNRICKQSPYMMNNIAIDTKQNLFFVTAINNFSFFYGLKQLKMKNNALYNLKTNKKISILHLAANINGNKQLEYLGYDVSNVHAAGSYKIRQVGTYIKELATHHKILFYSLIFIVIGLILGCLKLLGYSPSTN